MAVLVQAAPASAGEFREGDEGRVLSMVNATRASRGLPPLALNGDLVTLARRQSERMVEQNNLFHNLDLKNELDALGLNWAWSGENVGVGPDVDAIEQAFLNSDHHLENIVRSNYNAIGLGVLAAPSGYLYVTQVFAELRGAGAAAAPPPPPTIAAATPEPAPPAPAPVPTPAPTPTPPPPSPDLVVIEGGIVAPTAPLA